MKASLAVFEIVSLVMRQMPEESRAHILDVILDTLERVVRKTSNKWDDMVLLPLIRAAREGWDIRND